MDRCEICKKMFEATPENSVDMKILGLVATVCKQCAEQMAAKGEIRVLKQGGVLL